MARLSRSVATGLLLAALPAVAADYRIDTDGAHASIHFKVQHLGYSWLKGRFNRFSGEFSWDRDNPTAASIRVDIDVASIDSNHAERDRHLRGRKYLHTRRYPSASFVSRTFLPLGADRALLTGDLTLRGVTRNIAIQVHHIGEGRDPWFGYRAGFSGSTRIRMSDFGIEHELGEVSDTVILELDVEGIRQ